MVKLEAILKLFAVLICLRQFADCQVLNKSFSNLSTLRIKELEMNSNWRIIDLSHNSIKSVESPELLTKQRSLEKLVLDSNRQFAAIGNENIISNGNLKIFSCNSCGFEDIQSHHLSSLDNLVELYLCSNNISRIDVNAFKMNSNLKILDLSQNKIKFLHHSTFEALRDFEELRLTMNPIALPENKAFFKSESLKRLRMDRCEIIKIYSQTFVDIRNVEVLNLNMNLIEFLPANSLNLKSKLKSLFIESNRIKSFPIQLFDYLPQLDELCMDNNTFVENSDIFKLIQFYKKQRLRTENCSDNMKYFIENVFTSTTTNPSTIHIVQVDITTTTPEKSEKFVKNFIKPGISDFFIGSYLTFIIILQAIAFVMLSIYLIKIIKYEKLDGDVNYANTILNDNEIYKVYKSTE